MHRLWRVEPIRTDRDMWEILDRVSVLLGSIGQTLSGLRSGVFVQTIRRCAVRDDDDHLQMAQADLKKMAPFVRGVTGQCLKLTDIGARLYDASAEKSFLALHLQISQVAKAIVDEVSRLYSSLRPWVPRSFFNDLRAQRCSERVYSESDIRVERNKWLEKKARQRRDNEEEGNGL